MAGKTGSRLSIRKTRMEGTIKHSPFDYGALLTETSYPCLLPKLGRLVPAPMSILGLATRLVAKQDSTKRLPDILQVKIPKTTKIPNWASPKSVKNGFRKTVQRHLSQL